MLNTGGDGLSNHARQMHPTFPRPEIGDVTCPFRCADLRVWFGPRYEVLLHEIRRNVEGVVTVGPSSAK